MVTNLEVREELINCFFEAHKEFMKHSAKIDSDVEIKKQIVSLIQQAFNQVEGDFNNPSKQEFMDVIKLLQKQARDAGRDELVIQKHTGQMLDMLLKMK